VIQDKWLQELIEFSKEAHARKREPYVGDGYCPEPWEVEIPYWIAGKEIAYVPIRPTREQHEEWERQNT